VTDYATLTTVLTSMSCGTPSVPSPPFTSKEQAPKQNRDFLRVRLAGIASQCARSFLLIVVNIQAPLPSLVGQFSTVVIAHFHSVDPASRQNGLVGRYFPSRVITAREPPSGSSTFLISSLKLIALMIPSPNFS
jgi:hypothetical protein